ncbi:MAG: hypothetical protein CLLPBCKN_000446 [Chroococcidiopsis cubana SAG 39.79]|uniref:DUF4190 domain-containing protein n=1 Tax=Chroococcidiopsis cubana SAG 39.79 TaxID=388085 RepID=A0AB37UBU4_9CYAN|nr:hypothetical protein [Chroococcidiopsis cubana]MDZ4871058.1 hypothetical protein [Chroococcidiopsis cubana SAG 39.79]PSB65576.1 hypothetical protein C7B79_04755 [Chroococcidiopsis cubana CCALA 043]RUT02345.1 hypothetical protein DSM107010_62850 [Chroococcidiopsis cubana SAG 39.79]
MTNTSTNLSALDKFFITVTASGFVGGTVLSLMPGVIPLVPAIFFGSGISSLVYRFMGGISQDTKFELGIVKLGGTLASLVATIWIFNEIIKSQDLKQAKLIFSPKEHRLLALDRENGKLVPVNVVVDNIPQRISMDISAPDRSALKKIKDFCRTNQGFCEEPDLPAIFQKDITLGGRQAKVCIDKGDFVGYPLLIRNEKKPGTFARVNVITTDSCTTSPNEPMLIKVSPISAKDILGNAETGKGFVSIAPLRFIPE